MNTWKIKNIRIKKKLFNLDKKLKNNLKKNKIINENIN